MNDEFCSYEMYGCNCPRCSRIQKLIRLRSNPDLDLREAERRFQEDPTLSNRYYVNRLRAQRGLEPILDQWYADTLVEELRKLLSINANLRNNDCIGIYHGSIISIFPHLIRHKMGSNALFAKIRQYQELRIHVGGNERPAVYLDIPINIDGFIQGIELVHYNHLESVSGNINLLEEWLYNPQKLLEFLINELRLFKDLR